MPPADHLDEPQIGKRQETHSRLNKQISFAARPLPERSTEFKRWIEAKRLRLRLFSAAGRLVRGGRRLRLRIAAAWPWADQLTTAIARLQSLAPG